MHRFERPRAKTPIYFGLSFNLMNNLKSSRKSVNLRNSSKFTKRKKIWYPGAKCSYFENWKFWVVGLVYRPVRSYKKLLAPFFLRKTCHFKKKCYWILNKILKTYIWSFVLTELFRFFINHQIKTTFNESLS
jgi:hypothetical protein